MRAITALQAGGDDRCELGNKVFVADDEFREPLPGVHEVVGSRAGQGGVRDGGVPGYSIDNSAERFGVDMRRTMGRR